MNYCDLHCHSNFSDGTCTPEELIEYACEAGLSAIALTDHNTVGGVKRFLKAAEGKIEAVGGCEITTEFDGQELHLLGLFLTDENLGKINDCLMQQLERKEASNKDTLNRFAEDGYDISYEEFLKVYGNGIKNRLHIAKYLISKGVVESIDEAFSGVLVEGGRYYKSIRRLDFFEMIRLIKEVGGVAVWAHPLFHVDRKNCEEILVKAKEFGLDGIEVYYTTYSEDDTKFMQDMCRKYDLLASGGSDFHGDNKPNVKIGSGYGNLAVPYECYENLKKLVF